MTRTALVLLMLVSSSALFAQDFRTLSRGKNTYNHTDCERTGTCSLIRTTFLKEDYELRLQGVSHYGSRFIAEYETSGIESLEDYVFVQFISGCRYASRMVGDRVLPGYFFIYGPDGPVFNFPQWRVDTYDGDPVYGSHPKYGRHGYMRWRESSEMPDPTSIEPPRFYYAEKPSRPVLYIQDHPSSGFEILGVAWNVALRFNTCLYRSRDIPDRVDPEQPIEAEPLICYGWESHFVYDHRKGEYDWPRRGEWSCPAENEP